MRSFLILTTVIFLFGCGTLFPEPALNRPSLQNLGDVPPPVFNPKIEAIVGSADNLNIANNATPSGAGLASSPKITEEKNQKLMLDRLLNSVKVNDNDKTYSAINTTKSTTPALAQNITTPSTPSITASTITNPTIFDGHKITLKFNAKLLDRNIFLGQYELNYQLYSNRYHITTKLEPSGLVKMIYGKTLREESSGEIKNGELYWKNYEINEVDSNNKEPYIFESVVRSGDVVKLKNQEVRFQNQPLDIPSAFIVFMQKTLNSNSAWQENFDIFTSRENVIINAQRLGDENVDVPAGNFQTRVVRATPINSNSKLFLQVWVDNKQNHPVSIVFSNNKGVRFLMDLVQVSR